jgi:hypothetical protein
MKEGMKVKILKCECYFLKRATRNTPIAVRCNIQTLREPRNPLAA